MPLSSGAEVFLPRTEAVGVADAMIEAVLFMYEPDLDGQQTRCADGIARHFTGEVPV